VATAVRKHELTQGAHVGVAISSGGSKASLKRLSIIVFVMFLVSILPSIACLIRSLMLPETKAVPILRLAPELKFVLGSLRTPKTTAMPYAMSSA